MSSKELRLSCIMYITYMYIIYVYTHMYVILDLILSSRYIPCAARTHNPEIKVCMLH